MRIGIDGARGGWVAVTIDAKGRRDFACLETVAEIASNGASCAMIDMPIGLPEAGRRGCDIAGRMLLGAARSRIFLDARRPLLAYLGGACEAANRWAKSCGSGLSRQLWNILPKIAELDRAITPALQERVYEAHPELVFMRLAGSLVALPGKKTPEGFCRRRDLVAAAGFDAIDRWLAALPRGFAAADDLLDACALAWAAAAPRRVLCAREKDARGLAMDIWY